MQNSKLIKTLLLFTKEELLLLDSFLQSPYYIPVKLRNEIYPLFQYLIKQLRKKKRKLDGSIIYQHLFPGEAPIKGKLAKIMSALLKQIHRFISVYYGTQTSYSIRD